MVADRSHEKHRKALKSVKDDQRQGSREIRPRSGCKLMTIQMTDQEVLREITSACEAEHLTAVLGNVCTQMGFKYFALTHHVDMARDAASVVRIHNYPPQWVAYHDRNALGVSDPVHRASHTSCAGFLWSDMKTMIPLTAEDHRILAMSREHGLGDGFTVPANVLGKRSGSCSFANAVDVPIDATTLPLAQLVGLFAFERARRCSEVRPSEICPPRLTDRQRDCLLWVGRGKSDWEIGYILGISEDTVERHLTNARERYGVSKRTMLLVRALFDGTLSFSDILH
jgi:DNA-binding CsgD family transcriptional regulator